MIRVPRDVKAAIERRERSIRAEQQWWRELSELADAGEVAGFFGHYAEYLEECGVISNNRRILHKMARAVSRGQ